MQSYFQIYNEIGNLYIGKQLKKPTYNNRERSINLSDIYEEEES